MRFLHLADLHFGKSLHGVSLLENGDQGDWVDRFLELAADLRPDAILIAGDVYDRSAPSGEAVALLSRMLTALAGMGIPVLLTAGNHDSAQRLAFAAELLAQQGVYLAPPLVPPGELRHVTLYDACGPVTFWLLPYVYPALISQALGMDGLRESDGAVRALLARQEVDTAGRNVLLAHQNVTAGGVAGQRGGSESMVGGVGQIDYTAFDAFDYVALGHIHAAYPVGRESVRYAGSPLCYHFDETRQPVKGPLLVELGEKGTPVRVETLHIPPLHPLRELRGSYAEVCAELTRDSRRGEYLRVVLTDRRVTPEISAFLRSQAEGRESILMELVSEYRAFTGEAGALSSSAVEQKSVEELFADFYAERRGEPLSEEDAALLSFAGRTLEETGAERAAERLLDYLLRQEGRA